MWFKHRRHREDKKMQQIDCVYPIDKKEMYELLMKQMETILDGETDVIANLANASALLNEALPKINWVGFYLMKEGKLILGPFQGKLACIHIPLGKGVCGTAAETGELQLVKNVHEFPGHIACDSASNSEIVVPLMWNQKVIGVLDLDSPEFGRFDEIDAKYLQQIAKLIVRGCDWANACGYEFKA